jgi:hypothetical protein
MLSEQVLDLEFFSADPGRLISVYLSNVGTVIGELNPGNAFPFAPAPAS